MTGTDRPVVAVARAVAVLQALRRSPNGASARGLHEDVALPRSTVQRLLGTLEDSGMVVQDPADQRYRIGPQALLIGLGHRRGLDLVALTRPHLAAARDELGETVALAVRVGDARVFIDEAPSRQPLRVNSELGRQYPLWSGASGRVLCSDLTGDELTRALADESWSDQLFRAVPAVERAELVAATRTDGFAVARNETIENVSAVAIGIRDAHARVVAALSVSGPTSRMDEPALERARSVLTAHAEAVGAGLTAPA